jgi:hypothetical protein
VLWVPRFCVSCSCRPLPQRNPPLHLLGAAGQGRYYLYSSTLVSALGKVEVPSTFHAFRRGACTGAVAACKLCVICGVRLPQIRAQCTSLTLTLTRSRLQGLYSHVPSSRRIIITARTPFGNFPREPLPHHSALRSSHVCSHLVPCLANVAPRQTPIRSPRTTGALKGPFPIHPFPPAQVLISHS